MEILENSKILSLKPNFWFEKSIKPSKPLHWIIHTRNMRKPLDDLLSKYRKRIFDTIEYINRIRVATNRMRLDREARLSRDPNKGFIAALVDRDQLNL